VRICCRFLHSIVILSSFYITIIILSSYGTKGGAKVTLGGPQSVRGLCVKGESVIFGGSANESTGVK
jgi:hypothetical protein